MKQKKYQVMIAATDGDIVASDLLDTVEAARARLDEVRKEITETWTNPDPDAAYIHIVTM